MARERTSFPDATIKVLDVLDKGDGFTITGLSRETNLNRRTVEKVINVLERVQTHFSEKQIKISKINRMKTVQLTEKTGLLGFPEDIQKLIIRTTYYPAPSREEEILVHVFLKEATIPEKAVILEKTTLVNQLLEQGNLLETEKGIYLSDIGETIARGALKLYPELADL